MRDGSRRSSRSAPHRAHEDWRNGARFHMFIPPPRWTPPRNGLMIGWLYKHTHLGVGKIVGTDGRNVVRIRYVDGGAELTLSRGALQEGQLARVTLAPGTRCV